MKLKKKALLYAISNMAYVIADEGDPSDHSLHRVRDICEDGNIDRVSRVLGLAYSNILSVLIPLIESPRMDINRDNSEIPHDYEINFRCDSNLKFSFTKERKLKIKETAFEYMVSMVLADWLGVTYPIAADVWKFRAQQALEVLKEEAGSVMTGFSCGFRRKTSPF